MHEVYPEQYFNELYQVNAGDPWRYEERWYEKRKRQICLSVLPCERYSQAIEIGCSTGILTAALAQRCESLLGLDANAIAIQQARNQVPEHVVIQQAVVPQDLPNSRFDLIVLGEVLYYLPPDALNQVIEWLGQALKPNGCIVACHWRSAIDGFSLSGPDIHQRLKQHLKWHHYLSLHDADFDLDMWTAQTTSIAQQEGLR